jgi:hypothetical protein
LESRTACIDCVGSRATCARAEETKRYALAVQLLKQAAEEMGGAYTNKREVSGRDGAPLMPVVILPDNGQDGQEGVLRPAGPAHDGKHRNGKASTDSDSRI